MSNEDKIKVLSFRLHLIKERGKSADSPGVMHKIERQIRKLEGNY